MARHLTYANAMATLALFVALGGGAYAATRLPKNSVTTIQVKNGSLLSKDFKSGQLKAGKTGSKGAAGAAGARGFTGPTGPTGAQGNQGDKGSQGDQGLPGTAKVFAYITSQGGVRAGSVGITAANVKAFANSQYCITGLPFDVAAAVAQPDILSGGSEMIAQVEAPSENTGPCTAKEVYVRIAQLSIDDSGLHPAITSTGPAGGHGFYIAIN
jgi:hypothetical protein